VALGRRETIFIGKSPLLRPGPCAEQQYDHLGPTDAREALLWRGVRQGPEGFGALHVLAA
jgi:hypothetical protein